MPRPLKNTLKPINLGTETIGERLKRFRKKMGLTQEEIAEKVGITREAVSAYEAGRVRLVDEIVIRFVLILGISSDELLGIKEQRHEDSPSLKIMRRVMKIDKLNSAKQKAVLQTLDLALRGVGEDNA